VERVKAGLRNAKAKGKRLGRPRKILDMKRIAALRAQGVGWKRIAAGMGVLGSELSIVSPWRVPKPRKRFFEPCGCEGK
jgi:DNA invertase Pin-like site-specific DNA recombinase